MIDSASVVKWWSLFASFLCAMSSAEMTSSANAQCALSVAPAVSFAVGSNPRSLAMADFNGDGIPDLASANEGSNSVSILMGLASPNGVSFAAAVSYPVGQTPICVRSADFNGDARPDLVATNFNSHSVSVLLSSAGGVFQPAVHYPAGVNPSSVAVADFDGNGRRDLAIANWNSNTVRVLLGNTDGTFQVAGGYAVDSGSNAVATADFNGDARPDIIVAAYYTNNVGVLLGNGDGTFMSAVHFGVGANPSYVISDDVDGDGRPDIAAANISGRTISLYLNNGGNGTLSFAAASHYQIVGSNPQALASGDLNQDGNPDLVVANDGGTVPILRGISGGVLEPAADYGVNVPSQHTAVIVADLNADGRLDIAVANYAAASLSVLLNTSEYPPPVIIQQPLGQVVQIGSAVQLTVGVSTASNSPQAFQWRRNGTSLANASTVSGANTSTLTLSPIQLSDTASYDVALTTPTCGGGLLTTTSAPAIVAVVDPCGNQRPSFQQHPSSQIVPAGNAAVFSVMASGPVGAGSVTYQWRRNANNLSDAPTGTGSVTTGVTTPAMTISFASLADSGTIDCVVTNACGSTRSEPASLQVVNDCPADFNNSGFVSVQDIFSFLEAYFAGCP